MNFVMQRVEYDRYKERAYIESYIALASRLRTAGGKVLLVFYPWQRRGEKSGESQLRQVL